MTDSQLAKPPIVAMKCDHCGHHRLFRQAELDAMKYWPVPCVVCRGTMQHLPEDRQP
jgi:ssDNA-binding Zn-finger/Zn-ribbon topoisomerase 1